MTQSLYGADPVSRYAYFDQSLYGASYTEIKYTSYVSFYKQASWTAQPVQDGSKKLNLVL
jgi:hypothetical protein